ncbi:bestrophin-like domain [Paracidovorax citrulli]
MASLLYGLGWFSGIALALGLFATILLAMEAGRLIWQWHIDTGREPETTGVGAVGSAVFALLGLLIAFTFSGAASRFEERRNLIIQEANDIGTAYLRLDLLAPPARAELQETFRQYLDARLEAYRAVPDRERIVQALARADALRDSLWRRAVEEAPRAPTPAATMLLLPALNAGFDTASTRLAKVMEHPPTVIYVLLLALTWIGALFAGYGMARRGARNWLHAFFFAATLAVTLYVIVDLEFPRLGLIRVDAFDQVLQAVRDSMQ